MRYIPDRKPGDWLKIVWHETEVKPEVKPTELFPEKEIKHKLPRDEAAKLRLFRLFLEMTNRKKNSTGIEKVNIDCLSEGCHRKRKGK